MPDDLEVSKQAAAALIDNVLRNNDGVPAVALADIAFCVFEDDILAPLNLKVEVLREDKQALYAEWEDAIGAQRAIAEEAKTYRDDLARLRSALERVEAHGSGYAVTVAREALLGKELP